jgi:hypothetical protein
VDFLRVIRHCEPSAVLKIQLQMLKLSVAELRKKKKAKQGPSKGPLRVVVLVWAAAPLRVTWE